MLIGEQTARTMWPGADPIGQHVKIGGSEGPWYTIVGIVGDVRHKALAAPTTMQMYMPQAQLTDSFLTFVIRSGGDPSALAAEARQAIWSVASDVPVYEVAPLSDLVAKSVGPRRFMMVLLELFGAVALLMTAIGVYGVIAYSVAERTREIGIRAALGASSRDIVRLVVGGGLAVVGGGLAVGVVVAHRRDAVSRGIALQRQRDRSVHLRRGRGRAAAASRWPRRACRSSARCASSRPSRFGPSNDLRNRRSQSCHADPARAARQESCKNDQTVGARDVAPP